MQKIAQDLFFIYHNKATYICTVLLLHDCWDNKNKYQYIQTRYIIQYQFKTLRIAGIVKVKACAYSPDISIGLKVQQTLH